VTNDDVPTERLEALRAEHRVLDSQIDLLLSGGATDQIEIARLKKRKLRLRDEIALIEDQAVPDIIA
jgi:hypothetical protein